MSLYHVYTQTVADGTATSVVRPSDWNSAHAQQWALSGNTSGSSQMSGLDVTFVGGNNVTLSADTAASKLVFSVGNYLTTAMASNAGSNFVQANAVFNGTNATGTIASNAISISVNAQSTQPVAYSAANGSANFSTLVFADSNGVSFSTGTQGLYATVKTDYLTTAMASNAGSNFVQANAVFNGTNATGTIASNAISVSVNAQSAQTQASGAIAGTGFTRTTTTGTAVVGTLSTNGLSIGVPNFLTTARASNDAVGLNTAQSNVTWTVNSSGLSLDARGYAGTATTLALTNLSGTWGVNSNGIALSLNNLDDHFSAWNLVGNTSGTTSYSLSTEAALFFSGGPNVTLSGNSNTIVVSAGAGGGTTNQTGPNIADGNGNTVTSGTVVFSNSNGVSFGLNGSTMTASVDAGGGVAVEAGGGTASTGTVVFSNSNNITFGLNGQTMTASYADPYESIFFRPNDFLTTVGAPINNSASVLYVPMDHNLTATRFDIMASVSVATAGNTSSAAILWSLTAALYTLNGQTLSSVSSVTTNSEVRWQSNSTSSVTGAMFFSAPLNVNAGADKYWMAVALSTRATGQTGAATTSLGNTFSVFGVGSAQVGAFSVHEPGQATSNSAGWFTGMGMYSGTTNFSTIGLSNLTQAGTNMQRANIAIRLRA
jgi:hypothetical protein